MATSFCVVPVVEHGHCIAHQLHVVQLTGAVALGNSWRNLWSLWIPPARGPGHGCAQLQFQRVGFDSSMAPWRARTIRA